MLFSGVIQGSDDNVIKQGSVVPCRVVEVVDDGLLVATLLGKKGKVDICDIDDDFHDNPILKYGKDSKHKYIRYSSFIFNCYLLFSEFNVSICLQIYFFCSFNFLLNHILMSKIKGLIQFIT